ncbi:hypothetical protein BO86DRAFT_239938 [Aspergillus japonicus CBS 114.51]|uniref:Uncharacterized protein n=1 Tax=Aspergillus japonicus CBS 114.51 TaxID=1448312 RepID=A0A8T8X8V0_ASPJA|nr:hypothetical protein BO86DRAFT_239938 [Aspergillus japonicus CBS 114.51]RAH84314.1 hypothetical protein BO86DRAFT_239938 [Aspergillus japonicus CBS 114.51]
MSATSETNFPTTMSSTNDENWLTDSLVSRSIDRSEQPTLAHKTQTSDQKDGTRTRHDYTVGWVSVLEEEQVAATAMLFQNHPDLPKPPK